MSFLKEIMSTLFDRRLLSQSDADMDERPIQDICRDLVKSTGEVSLALQASRLLSRYDALDEDGRRDFFHVLARDMGIDIDRARGALDRLAAGATRDSYAAFLAATEPARQELIRRINQAPNATERLVAMRHDLMRLAKDDPELQALDLDFRHLFASWFNRGFLVLRRISWESPAHILEKIIAYEAVHAIDSWDELRRRLEPADRRCFAFFHPAMPNEPLIFVEVALTKGIPGSIQALLADNREKLRVDEARTAVFYSISNCQPGLAGISFGNSLIKQVVSDLSNELPNIKTFVTLSPIPGFASWLTRQKIAVTAEEAERVEQLAAHYLMHAKRPDGQPLDPVARFHLGNGAEIHALRAGADLSPKGREQSAGAMVNYLYDLAKVARNHEDYSANGKIAASAALRKLAAEGRKQEKQGEFGA